MISDARKKQIIKEEIEKLREGGENSTTPIVTLLNQIINLSNNIGEADNFDLEDFRYKLE